MNFRLLRPALSGSAATCSGNGLARFAYVPLFPAMVASGWVDGGQAAEFVDYADNHRFFFHRCQRAVKKTAAVTQSITRGIESDHR